MTLRLDSLGELCKSVSRRYGKAFELPDGSLLVACQDTGGHAAADAKQMSLRLLRLRIRAGLSGIDLLPASPRQN